MFDLGALEIAVIALVALVLLGPQDLAVVMRQLGRWSAAAQRYWQQLQQSWQEPPAAP